MESIKKQGGSAIRGRIRQRGTLIAAVPGDYRPLAYHEGWTDAYWGFDIELVWKLASYLGVKMDVILTSWEKLEEDAKTSRFDLAAGGISRTEERARKLTLSDGYLSVGKTILCRRDDAARYKSLADVNQPDVRILYNPGGTNEHFIKTHLPKAALITWTDNSRIPSRLVSGHADVMVTDTVEAAYYAHQYPELTAPLIDKPFTTGEFCLLMGRESAPLVSEVNEVLRKFREDGTLLDLKKKYLGSLADA